MLEIHNHTIRIVPEMLLGDRVLLEGNSQMLKWEITCYSVAT